MKIGYKWIGAVALGSLAMSPAMSQIVATKVDQSGLTLPANTMVYVSLNSNLTSKRTKLGDQFDVTVTRPVIVGDYVVVPQGTVGHGRITWRTGKAVFGKSAKMEFELTELDIGNTMIPLSGKYRLEGEGNTGWTIGAVVGFGIVGGLVTGKSASAQQGTEYRAYTVAPVAFSLDNSGTQMAATGVAPVSISGRGSNMSDYEKGRHAASVQMAAVGPSIQAQ